MQLKINKTTGKWFFKNSEWDKIADEFNASHGINCRKYIQLKSLWKNMEARTKSVIAKNRRERSKTGGGPAKTEQDAVSTAISTLFPQQINSTGNEFNDDAALHGDLEKNSIIYEMVSTKKNQWKVPELYIFFYLYESKKHLQTNTWICYACMLDNSLSLGNLHHWFYRNTTWNYIIHKDIVHSKDKTSWETGAG